MSLRLYLEIMRSLGIKEPDPPPGLGRVVEGLPSWFDVSGLAAEASIAATAVQVAAISDLGPQNINVETAPSQPRQFGVSSALRVDG